MVNMIKYSVLSKCEIRNVRCDGWANCSKLHDKTLFQQTQVQHDLAVGGCSGWIEGGVM